MRCWKIRIWKSSKFLKQGKNIWISEIVSSNNNIMWSKIEDHKFRAIKNAKSFIKAMSKSSQNISIVLMEDGKNEIL